MPLDDSLERLICAADEALRRVQPDDPSSSRPTTDTCCGAAILTKTGQIYTGVNISHFTGAPCAEHTAIGNALMNGARGEDFTHIVAVVADERRLLSPCGKCRQILVDFYPQIQVIVPTPDDVAGPMRVVSMDELLPFAYKWKKKKSVAA